MVWASPLVLGLGGVLLAMPIILHLLMQPKPKVFEFPALQFVRKKQFTNASTTRLRHVLLLLLRCLLILLMAAALAGPSVASREFGQWFIVGAVGLLALIVSFALLTVWFGSEKRSMPLVGILAGLLAGLLIYAGMNAARLMNSDSSQMLGDSAAPVSALILIDNACRMQYEHENKTNFERAQEIGHWLIEQFPADSQVGVVTTKNDLPFFSVDLGAAKKRIDGIHSEFLNAPIPSRVVDGLQLLDEAVHERQEIYIVSDLSKKSWEANAASIASQLKVDDNLSVFVIDVGLESVNNFAIEPIQLSSESISVEGGIELVTSVSRVGRGAKRNVRMRLEKRDSTRPVIRDGEVQLPEEYIERVRTLDVQPNAVNEVSFQFSDPLPLGITHGHIEIVGDDALAVDNRKHFTIEVVQSWRILVIHGDDVNPANFVESIVDDVDSTLFDITTVAQKKTPGSFDEYDAVFYLDPGPDISETRWNTIKEYVQSGHGVGFFLGAGVGSKGLAHEKFQTDAAQIVLSGAILSLIHI